MPLPFSFMFSFSLFLCNPFWKIPSVWSPISWTHVWTILRFNSSIEFLFQWEYFSLPNLLICYFYNQPFLFDEASHFFLCFLEDMEILLSVVSWPLLVLAACPSCCWSFLGGFSLASVRCEMWECLVRSCHCDFSLGHGRSRTLVSHNTWKPCSSPSHVWAFFARYIPGWTA